MNTYAFPSGHDPKTGTAQFGMNLRDYFAAKAIHVVMAGHSISNPEWKDDVAKSCYEIADAMMKARDL
jgi:hypothetical protein